MTMIYGWVGDNDVLVPLRSVKYFQELKVGYYKVIGHDDEVICQTNRHCIRMSSLEKVSANPGWQVGYPTGDNEVVLEEIIAWGFNTSGDTCIPIGPSFIYHEGDSDYLIIMPNGRVIFDESNYDNLEDAKVDLLDEVKRKATQHAPTQPASYPGPCDQG